MEEIPERREPIRPVPIRALAKLTRRAPDGFRDLIRFLARTGCRQEEAASLEWSQLDLRSVPATCTFSRTKTRSPRVIELTSRQANELRRILRSPDSPYVFRSPQGQRYKNVPGRFRVLLRKALGAEGDVFRCHDLRHTYAIRALQQKRSIYDVARQLGHSSVKTTERYAGWLSQPMR
nr:site-specific integrase [Komagataeibacter sp. FNDCR2]